MPYFPKPAEGSWTEHYPHLRTTPTTYADSVSPDWYEAERDAVFRRTWLNVGRVEQLARVGSYFTKELDAVGTSVIVVRSGEHEYRAFHNICRHRGNKLVWSDFPAEETSGFCRQFQCKYHAWRYDLDGSLAFIQQEEEFFDVDKADYPLASVHLEVWEGWIFINFDPATPQPLSEYLGLFGQGLEGFPFDKMTQVHKYRAEIGANWKLFIDAFVEFYHAPVLHVKQATAEESAKLNRQGYEALHYEIDGPHAVVSSWGGMAPPKDPSIVKPIERILRSGLFGMWDYADVGCDIQDFDAVNRSGMKQWGLDSFLFFPNFMILTWKPNWLITYHYWPTSYNTHIFEGVCYFVPPENALVRLRQELAVASFKEYGLQDGNTLEATQRMIESYTPVKEFPLNDQEILIRHLHQTVQRYVEDFAAANPPAKV